MTALSRGTQARALLLINMVAGSYWCPTLRAGGRRVDPWALGPGIAATMADAKQNNAGLPLFPGESPKVEEVKEWWKLVKPLITADQLALFNGTVPRALLDYTLATVPPTLTASTGGLSESAVESRNAMILTIQDANATKIKERVDRLRMGHGRASSRRSLDRLHDQGHRPPMQLHCARDQHGRHAAREDG